jgi:transposase
LIPKRRGDRVKTDKRDARRLAGLHRAGELTPIGIPSPAQEAVRDLCRTRGDMVEDLTRARNRLTKFLLRHSLVWREGSNWTFKHQRWLAGLHFDDRALAATFAHYRATVALHDSSLAAVETDLVPYFDAARSFMSFTALVPSENSTGLTEHRANITHAGNRHIRAQLVEAAWAYQHRPHVGTGIAARHDGLPPQVIARAWNAQVRLSSRFRKLAARKNVRSVVAAAVARELAGFLWAEMTAEPTNTN